MDDFPAEFYKAFGIKKARYPRELVENYEVIKASTPGIFARFGISMTVTQLRQGVCREWFQCPGCKACQFKLFRPTGGKDFACQKCNHLVYRSSLKRNLDGSPKLRVNAKPHVPFQKEEFISDSGYISSPASTKWLPKPNRGEYVGPP